MDFKALFSQLIALYLKLTRQQQTIILTVIVGIVAFLMFLVLGGANKEDKRYVVLFDSLDSAMPLRLLHIWKKNIYLTD